MKTLITALAIVLFAFAPQAQEQSKKEQNAYQPAKKEQTQQDEPKEAHKKTGDDKALELDQNTRAHLNTVRHKLYNFGQKPGC